MTIKAMQLLAFLGAATIFSGAASAEDWRASGMAHGDSNTNMARIGVTITQADGSPVLGLTRSDFAVYGYCGLFMPKATISSVWSIKSEGQPVAGEGDYIVSASMGTPFKLTECDGFVVKVIAKGGGAGSPSFRQRLSFFVPLRH